ncbi:hypothetical protein Q31b_15780 [Novipirellula aureliae]|uniref:Uncharacterized protein n=1 Tax=Novipirellula aureliae TaxID=2527966 RepID=A0A5C6E317_9BACT|nr:hypothetical protein Q31b_15780 [Novipirellula aureliae]
MYQTELMELIRDASSGYPTGLLARIFHGLANCFANVYALKRLRSLLEKQSAIAKTANESSGLAFSSFVTDACMEDHGVLEASE